MMKLFSVGIVLQGYPQTCIYGVHNSKITQMEEFRFDSEFLQNIHNTNQLILLEDTLYFSFFNMRQTKNLL